ncbi:MAG: CAP domain-containing protein [Planctomycetota bacterium]|nr:MAG: CAP domain-containing protein [Planctomycetota bacterium]
MKRSTILFIALAVFALIFAAPGCSKSHSSGRSSSGGGGGGGGTGGTGTGTGTGGNGGGGVTGGGPCDGTADEQLVFDLINQNRADQGLEPLEWHSELAAVARAHSECQRDHGTIYHVCSYGHGSPRTRIDAAGIYCSDCSENVAWNAGGAAAVVSSWMGSSGHRAAILGGWTHVGIGIAMPNYYTTAKFIR